MQFVDDYAFLDLRFRTPVHIGFLHFKNAYSAYKALICKNNQIMEQFCNATPGQADALIARYGATEDTQKMLEALTRVNVRKFERPQLMRRLQQVTGQIIFDSSDDSWLGKVNNKGLNMLGNVLMSIRDDLVEPLTPDDDVMPKKILGPLHPGHVRNVPKDDSRVLIKLPYPNLTGTVSLLAPAEDVTFTDKRIKSGKYAGKPYLCLVLNQPTYAQVFHDDTGTNITGVVDERIDADSLIRLFERNSKLAAQKVRRRQQNPSKTPSSVIVNTPFKNDLFDKIDIVRDPDGIAIAITTYPNQPLFLKIDLTNIKTKTSKCITCPNVFDRPHRVDAYMVSIDLTLYQKETEFLTALHIIQPALADVVQPTSNVVYDQSGNYAFSLFYINPKFLEFKDRQLSETYEKAYLIHENDIIEADPEFRKHRQQGQATINTTLEVASRRILKIFSTEDEGAALRLVRK